MTRPNLIKWREETIGDAPERLLAATRDAMEHMTIWQGMVVYESATLDAFHEAVTPALVEALWKAAVAREASDATKPLARIKGLSHPVRILAFHNDLAWVSGCIDTPVDAEHESGRIVRVADLETR